MTSQQLYTLLGLTGIVAALIAVVAFALVKFVTNARRVRGLLRDEDKTDRAFVAAALEDAVGKLKAHEREVVARAEESERLSDQIITSLTAGLLVVDLQGKVRILNPAGRRLLDEPSVAPGGHYAKLLAGAAPLADLVGECLAHGKPISRQVLPLPGGRRITHLGVTLSPLVDGTGKLRGVICLFSDVSAVVDLEEQVRLKDSLSRLGELTAGLAHEFRNALGTIHGYSRLIRLEDLPEAYRTCVQGIRDEADALNQLVTDFLGFARPAPLSLASVDLRALVERAAAEIRADVEARGGEVTFTGEFQTTAGDEALLEKAFGNVLRNAVEATAGQATAPHIEVGARLDHDRHAVVVAVRDNGPGFAAGSADRVFRPFFTTKPHGTGLGLAIVQRIIVSHNGRVTASTADGGGGIVEIELPLTEGSGLRTQGSGAAQG